MAQTISEYIAKKKAIVIEDDVAIAQLLKIHLVQLGFDVEIYHETAKAELSLSKNSFTLCLLDWMLPGTQGIDFLKKNKKKFKNTKIMMVTAKADSDSIVEGLESGADDYLTKPFDAKVLVARIRQLMRSHMNESQWLLTQSMSSSELVAQMSLNGLSVDIQKHIVTLNEKEIHLTPSEFKLLAELFKARGKVLTRDKLIDLIQGQDVSVTGRTIDTHVFALRKKIGNWSEHIETIRGVGYRILISEQDRTEPKQV